MNSRPMMPWLAALFGAAIVLGGAWVSTELPARFALRDAGFSHKTYWKGFPSWSATTIHCADRKVTKFDWIAHFPSLQKLELTSGRDNCNRFPTLVPFAQIQNLRVLKLAGVDLKTLDDFPVFPHLEELEFWESGVRFASSTEALKILQSRLPKIHSLRWLSDDDLSCDQIVYDADSGRLVFVEEIN